MALGHLEGASGGERRPHGACDSSGHAAALGRPCGERPFNRASSINRGAGKAFRTGISADMGRFDGGFGS